MAKRYRSQLKYYRCIFFLPQPGLGEKLTVQLYKLAVKFVHGSWSAVVAAGQVGCLLLDR